MCESLQTRIECMSIIFLLFLDVFWGNRNKFPGENEREKETC